jgi:hypothetical protein
MARTRYADPRTMLARKKRLVSEIHAIWPSSRGVDHRLVRRIIEAVRASGRRGMTGDEMERSLRVLHQSLGASLIHARKTGHIKNSGRVRKTRNNHDAIVWEAM